MSETTIERRVMRVTVTIVRTHSTAATVEFEVPDELYANLDVNEHAALVADAQHSWSPAVTTLDRAGLSAERIVQRIVEVSA